MSESNIFVPNLITMPTATDVEFLYDVAQGWDARFRPLSKHKVVVTGRLFHLPHMQYAEETYRGSYLLQGCFPNGCVVLSVVRSQEIVSFKNRTVEENELMILFSGDELDVLFNGMHQVFTLTVDEAYFNEAFLHYFNRPVKELLTGERFFIDASKTDRYLSHMRSWVNYLHQRGLETVSFKEFLYIEREILFDLFSALRVEEERKTVERVLIPKARALLHESLDHEMRIEEVAHSLGVSVRTLQHYFRKELGVTPKQYLQSLRLNAIREELLKAKEGTVTVGDIAFKYNYFHLGHFSSEYKRMFGETPSQTLQKRF